MRKYILTIMLMLSATAANAQTQNGLSVLDIFDQYTISKGAALVCLEPDAALDKNYDANFSVVYKKAWQRLRELKKSDVSNEEITKTLNKRIKDLRANVAKDATSEGCDSKSYKELINLYKYHAIWNPFTNK